MWLSDSGHFTDFSSCSTVYSRLLFSPLIFTPLLQLRISSTLKNYKTTICPATCQTHTPIFPIPNIPILGAYEPAQSLSRVQLTLWDPMDYTPPSPWDSGIFPARIPGVGCHFLLQGIFPTRDQTHISYIGRQIFTLSHLGIPIPAD